jgi:hypothetical protein
MDDVDPTEIEVIVGVPRHPDWHYGRAVSVEERVYILHSQQCHDHYDNLRDCPYSVALNAGIDESSWVMDAPVLLEIHGGRIYPREEPDGTPS